MKNILFALLFIATVSAWAQEITVKNIDGVDVDFNKIVSQSQKNQPTIILAWAKLWCNTPCFKTIEGFSKRYNELKEQYNLRIILINVDGEGDEKNKERLERLAQSGYENITSFADYVRAVSKEKNWTFESYSDEYGNFKKQVKLTETPYTSLMVNGKTKLQLRGWVGNTFLETKGFDTSVLENPYEFPAYFFATILSQMHGLEGYYNKDWIPTIKEFDPVYKRTVVKVGDLYEITDSWITGEIQMRATSKDITGNTFHGKVSYYYKNGVVSSQQNYLNGVLNGAYKEYNERGELTRAGTFVDGIFKIKR